MISVYLDACSLNRPFDDRSQTRVRTESDAVVEIIGRFQANEWQWIGSDTLEYEINRIQNPLRRAQIRKLMPLMRRVIIPDFNVEKRAVELALVGLKGMDARHLACAEYSRADVLLTTDDRFLRKAQRLGDRIMVKVDNPVLWLREVMT